MPHQDNSRTPRIDRGRSVEPTDLATTNPAHLRLVLAPLRGITGDAFRTAFVRHFGGFDSALAPFITTVSAPAARASHYRDIAPDSNLLLPIVPQLIGKNPDDFVRMAETIHAMGYTEVNLNLGCPYPMVTRKGRGSGMLPYPDRVRSFLNHVTPRIPVRLSVKARLGLSAPDELRALMPVFNEYPLASLTIHARTAGQMYEGAVDLDRYGECLALSKNPVVYSGDIASASCLARLRARFPETDAWMLGRGAVANPFLPWQIRNGGAQPEAPAGRIAAFHEELYAVYRNRFPGTSPLLGAMKELWKQLAPSFHDSRQFLKSVKRATRTHTYESIVGEFFAGKPRWTGTPETAFTASRETRSTP